VQPQYQSYGAPHAPPPHYPSQPLTPPPPQPQRTPSFEEQILATLKNLEATAQLTHSHSQSISKIETQLGQLAASLSRREEGKLPSQVVGNPKGTYMAEGSTSQDPQCNEDVQAVTVLRSGKIVDNKVGEKEKEKNEKKKAQVSEEEKEKEKDSDATRNKLPTALDDPVASYVPKAPFPSALIAPGKTTKKGASMSDMLEVFKSVHINLPLLDAIKQIPSYAKFLK
ncbi:hypothetical protein, partial [Modestobacter italicus]|uniref:hypothetical protein n=1 Tax=Modestobacter italicus (strain DSM 44449 / CECT 9708 / BC 501) TaxID=2732864 RepID=UPI001C93B120